MRHIAILSALALAIFTESTGNVLAGPGVPPINLPEPSTLAVLAAGIGALAILKFQRRK